MYTLWLFYAELDVTRLATAHAYPLAYRFVQEMAVVVRMLLAALVGLYWSSSRVEGNVTENYI